MTEPADGSSSATRPVPITIAYGDGIGPEIMTATLDVLRAAKAALAFETIEVGLATYQRGVSSGMGPEAWDSLRRTKLFLKGPITTPLGSGYKSLNVTTRTALNLFANVRPCMSYAPYVRTHHPLMDLVIIRENEEDTYAGIEHRQTTEMTQCLKLISQPGCERIVRYAFEYARQHGRRKVSCFTKSNIMKLTDGLFQRTFEQLIAEYPEFEHEHLIIDIGTALVADMPERFDVIVTPNLYGDILSDVAAQVAGSVGMSGSANVGADFAMFEAIHGSAPMIAGKDIANPSGLLHGAIMLLVHVGQTETAARIKNAWLRTIEDGLHTPDIFRPETSTRRVGTQEFAAAVIERLGQEPLKLPPARSVPRPPAASAPAVPRAKPKKQLVGVDVFLDWDEAGRAPQVLGERVGGFAGSELRLKMITNRGVLVYPSDLRESFCTDHWRCRFMAHDGRSPVTPLQILALLERLHAAGFDFVKTEHLYDFDGQPGYSLGQGE
ncbi:MAG: NADP-dependent isocitrate dehydrogenase [Pirellulales bacterium]|nr:NADP-dependent isocitrate dehydrogenase [Pirellulales bacterium]